MYIRTSYLNGKKQYGHYTTKTAGHLKLRQTAEELRRAKLVVLEVLRHGQDCRGWRCASVDALVPWHPWLMPF